MDQNAQALAHGYLSTPVGDLFPFGGNRVVGDGSSGSIHPIRAGELRIHSADPSVCGHVAHHQVSPSLCTKSLEQEDHRLNKLT